MTKSIRPTLSLLLAALVLCLGCTAGVEDETSETINAQTGGTVQLAESRLVIPANALENDTLVTLRIDDIAGYPVLEGAHSEVLNIEPADLVLGSPAELTLVLGAGQNTGAIAHHFRDGVWIPLPGLETSGGGLQVSIATLGPFAVVPRRVDGGGNEVRGVVTWGTGDPAVGVPVSLLVGGSQLTQIESDAEGVYRFVDLTPGSYTLAVDFECSFEATVDVSADAPTIVDIPLCQ